MFETSLSKLKSKDQTRFEIHHIYPQYGKVFTKEDEVVKTCVPLPPPDVVPPGPEHLLRGRVTHHPRHEGGAQHRHDVTTLLLSQQ